MANVITIKGLIDRSLLEVKDIIFEEESARVIATEWYLEGELVRRDVNVNILAGINLSGEQATI